MKMFLPTMLALGCAVFSCGGGQVKAPVEQLDEEAAEVLIHRLPDTTFSSVSQIQFVIEQVDSSDGTLQYLDDPYLARSGDNLTFRGGQKRDYPFPGRLDSAAVRLEKVWAFDTYYDTTGSVLGTWGGGSGWTGQPLHVHWPDSAACKDEIIVGSLCSRVYFIDFNTGKASRPWLDAKNVLKGTSSLDPSLNGNLYIGHGVRKGAADCGLALADLNTHRIEKVFGHDKKAYRGWDGNDSSPVVAGGFLFRPSENGTIYKYIIGKGSLTLHSCLRYKYKSAGPGIESSMAVFRNYGYVGDNRGNIICLNLDNLTPVWVYQNHDDTDASIVVEEVDGVPWLYSGTEVDKQGSSGFSYLVKLNGLTGERVWEYKHPCSQLHLTTGKIMEGGMYTTPLLGRGDCDSLLFTCFETHRPALKGDFVALNRHTGKVVYTIPLPRYAWSSPVPFYHGDKLYIVQPDCKGTIHLIDAREGKILDSLPVGNNFESSAVVSGDTFVIGSRGKTIYKVRVR